LESICPLTDILRKWKKDRFLRVRARNVGEGLNMRVGVLCAIRAVTASVFNRAKLFNKKIIVNRIRVDNTCNDKVLMKRRSTWKGVPR